MIIGLVSWLSDREIDRSLCRARESEAALARERANLEIKVNERTQQLEETQLLHLMELRRFAEFGRLSANLLHEVANPLTAASLSLQLIDDRRYPGLVWQARKNLKHIERYVESARKQLKGQGEITTFCVRSELNQVTSKFATAGSASERQSKLKSYCHPQPNGRCGQVQSTHRQPVLRTQLMPPPDPSRPVVDRSKLRSVVTVLGYGVVWLIGERASRRRLCLRFLNLFILPSPTSTKT